MKDIIYNVYTGKEYQVSTAFVYDCYFETMIFPIEEGVVSGREVYKWESYSLEEAVDKHRDIKNNPEKYISDEAIAEYMKSKEEDFEVEVNVKFPFQFLEQYLRGELSLDESIDRTLEETYRLINEYIEKHSLKT